jgi:flagellar biosynthetic protein FliR
LIDGYALDLYTLSFALILARVSAFVATFPLLGGRSFPRLVKLGLAMSLAWMWFGIYGMEPSADVRGAAEHVHWVGMALAVTREVVLGAVLGFGFGLFLMPLRIAGAYIGQEMGLSMAVISDPSQGDSSSIVAQLMETLGVLLFFSLDVHHVLLLAVHASLECWPCGSTLPAESAMAVVRGIDDAQAWGLLVAAPVGICLFVTMMVLLFLARSAPQLNLFSVGLTVRLVVGLVACLVFLPEMWYAMQQILGKVAGLTQVLFG